MYSLKDDFGVIPDCNYDRVFRAIRAARMRASQWHRTVFVTHSGKFEWVVSPKKVVTKRLKTTSE